MLKLLKEAVLENKFSDNKKQTLKVLESTLGKEKARRIVEGYQISPEDYAKWLDVITGYARDENIPLRTKANFQDVAYAVLENDPAMIDQDMQDAVVGTLWANFKAQQSHSKVEKVARAKEEEEQLNYALKKMRGGSEEEEECCPGLDAYTNYNSQRAKPRPTRNPDASSTGMDAYAEYNRNRMAKRPEENEEFDDEYYDDDEDFDYGEDLEQDLPFDEEDDYSDEDDYIMQRGDRYQHERDLEDFDPASEEGMDYDENIMRRAKSQPRAYFATENEEQGIDYKSPFHNKQLVTYKKDNGTYKVEIADGPGDQVGILVNNRVTMVPSKDLAPVATSEENEETGNKRPKQSFLHDVLTGENSRNNLTLLQKQIEDEAANAWTAHHAKMPRNPHPKGSIAYKAWEKGIASAAKSVWAPKPVLDPKAKTKSKPKKK